MSECKLQPAVRRMLIVFACACVATCTLWACCFGAESSLSASPSAERRITVESVLRTYWVETMLLLGGSVIITGGFIHTIVRKNKALKRDLAEIRERDEKILYLTYHDKLTGLYNRTYLEEAIENFEARNIVPMSVIIGDVNQLKLINDVLGHREGDLLIRGVARTLLNHTRADDVVARPSGDEFVILMPRTSKEEARRVINSIQKEREERDVGLIPVSLSLGYATKTRRKESVRKIIGDAESMMYKQKLRYARGTGDTIIRNLEEYLQKKDPVSYEHGLRVEQLLLAMGRRMHIAQKELQDLSLLARMHDIGKVVTDEAVSLRKVDTLDSEEAFQQIRSYPEAGFRIASSSQVLFHIALPILHQNEWWNGTGYPHELKEESIPLYSRMLAVANAYDVMTTDRPYRNALSQQEAIEELTKGMGEQFDPTLVPIFIRSLLDIERDEQSISIGGEDGSS